MGRETRMVVPNWEHPKGDDGSYQPLNDEDFDTAITQWYEGYLLWKKGEHPSQKEGHEYSEWEGPPPDPDFYRPKWVEDATWVQMYETVSEGTPVTPPFATKEELVDYLVTSGTFWDERGWEKENAKKFVNSGCAPTALLINGEYKTARDGI